MVINAVAEHPRNPDLLFAGTEFGLFFTIDAGKSWHLAARQPAPDAGG